MYLSFTRIFICPAWRPYKECDFCTLEWFLSSHIWSCLIRPTSNEEAWSVNESWNQNSESFWTILQTSMTVRRLESHLHIVSRGHNFVAWWPLGTHATWDRLSKFERLSFYVAKQDNTPRAVRHSQYQRKVG